jgi:hypothetical protein
MLRSVAILLTPRPSFFRSDSRRVHVGKARGADHCNVVRPLRPSQGRAVNQRFDFDTSDLRHFGKHSATLSAAVWNKKAPTSEVRNQTAFRVNASGCAISTHTPAVVAVKSPGGEGGTGKSRS